MGAPRLSREPRRDDRLAGAGGNAGRVEPARDDAPHGWLDRLQLRGRAELPLARAGSRGDEGDDRERLETSTATARSSARCGTAPTRSTPPARSPRRRWCSGCAGGAYVVGIVPAVEASFERTLPVRPVNPSAAALPMADRCRSRNDGRALLRRRQPAGRGLLLAVLHALRARSPHAQRAAHARPAPARSAPIATPARATPSRNRTAAHRRRRRRGARRSARSYVTC